MPLHFSSFHCLESSRKKNVITASFFSIRSGRSISGACHLRHQCRGCSVRSKEDLIQCGLRQGRAQAASQIHSALIPVLACSLISIKFPSHLLEEWGLEELAGWTLALNHGWTRHVRHVIIVFTTGETVLEELGCSTFPTRAFLTSCGPSLDVLFSIFVTPGHFLIQFLKGHSFEISLRVCPSAADLAGQILWGLLPFFCRWFNRSTSGHLYRSFRCNRPTATDRTCSTLSRWAFGLFITRKNIVT